MPQEKVKVVFRSKKDHTIVDEEMIDPMPIEAIKMAYAVSGFDVLQVIGSVPPNPSPSQRDQQPGPVKKDPVLQQNVSQPRPPATRYSPEFVSDGFKFRYDLENNSLEKYGWEMVKGEDAEEFAVVIERGTTKMIPLKSAEFILYRRRWMKVSPLLSEEGSGAEEKK